MRIHTARVRDEAAPDGARVLVDRLWPRGVSKERAALDWWATPLTPSTDLRRWYHAHKDERHDEFIRRYRAELDGTDHDEHLAHLRDLADGADLVLLSDVTDISASHVPVLHDWLAEHLS